jgi:hypothetical protein
MIRGFYLAVLGLLGACATSGSSTGPRVSLEQGEQLRLWGVEAQIEADALAIEGQVSRTALPRGSLVEHVYVEVRNEAGAIIAFDDASIYPVTALRGAPGHAHISSRLPRPVNGHLIQIRVVKGVPHE